MRIQPRQQILDLWRSMLMTCVTNGTWSWGGREGSNSISDAEQLLCLLYPATEIDSFALDQPDHIADDVRTVLEPLGEGTRLGAMLVTVLEEYIFRHTDPDGEPIFSAGSYLRAKGESDATDEQRTLEIVDAYSMSLTLCLSALRFLNGFERYLRLQSTRRDARALIDRIDVLSGKVGVRLTATMAGLVRSFVVNTVDRKSEQGRSILSMLNQTGAPDAVIADNITTKLKRVRYRLQSDITLGQTPDTEFEDENLVECGWSWGIVQDAAKIEFLKVRIADQIGFAEARPYLYFTIVALDGIFDLVEPSTRELLDDDQRRLAEALVARADLTQGYWSTIARFGEGRWPLEDIPWRTSDGGESDYFSLVVSAVFIQDLVNREATDEDLTRAVAVFEELARRGRVTSRVLKDDWARGLHLPGVGLTLLGSENYAEGPPLLWMVADFAALLLKRTLQAAGMSRDVAARDRLMRLAEAAMEHLGERRLRAGPATGLWDDIGRVFSATTQPETKPSWYLTERVMESLVTADKTFRELPLRPPSMVNRAVELLNEAEHLLNQELLDVSGEDPSPSRVALGRVEQRLRRARKLIAERPGTSFSLAQEALIQLDELAYARQDATRGS